MFLVNGRQIAMATEDGARTFKVLPKGREEMVYFAAMLTNFLEAYGIVLNGLHMLQKKPQTEKELLNKLRAAGQRLYKQGQVLRPEALSLLLYQNAIRMAKDQGMIVAESADVKQPVLSFNSGSEDVKNQMLTHISKFIRVEKYHYLEK